MRKKILKALGAFVGIACLVLLSVVAPVDRTPYRQMPYYRETMARLQTLGQQPSLQATAGLKAGWAKVNITPPYRTPTAGYGNRRGKLFEKILDSLFVRAIVLDNGALRVALVSLDLLIVPPNVTARLRERLPTIGFSLDRTYLAATHSHNSLGGWGQKFAGRIIAGKYDPRVETLLTEAVVRAVDEAQRQLAAAQVGFRSVAAPALVYNRLVGPAGATDPAVRMIKFQKRTGETALLCTYAAHPTCLSISRLALSRDYPGALVDALEKKDRISVNFAMFMAGAVGSQGPVERGNDESAVHHLAQELNRTIENQLPCVAMQPDTTLVLRTLSLPLALREPYRRIAKNWTFRPWVFNWLYGRYPVEIKALRIGSQVLIGTPCDFSGELVPALEGACRQRGLNLLITSFNGGYIGYLTPDQYYDHKSYETRDMNWFGPYNAAYFTELIRGLIQII